MYKCFGMRAVLANALVSILACACGARTDGIPDRDGATAPLDAPVVLDAPPADGGPRPVCEGLTGFGTVEGFVPSAKTFSFPYVALGVESPTTHSCPRFFLRAGDAPDFSGDYLDIEVPYDVAGPFTPGVRAGTLTVHAGGGEWTEEIQLDVRRADGLFDLTVPIEAWRGSATIDHHDATTDMTATIVDAEYRPCFAICL
jgi:hypothetical protein